ncbi:MAG: J domain-containing protein [Treponema sp.]|nr:J domain-containing protein [Treponema sp.]
MGIFERLEDLVKSYLNDGDEPSFRFPGERRSGDPDINSAYEELDEFLNAGKNDAGNFSTGKSRKGESGPSGGRTAGNRTSGGNAVPEELRGDFAELGVPFGASANECKAAYKQLLKKHHPDRHAGHQGNMRKATEKSARVNAAFDRIEKWRAAGRPG